MRPILWVACLVSALASHARLKELTITCSPEKASHDESERIAEYLQSLTPHTLRNLTLSGLSKKIGLTEVIDAITLQASSLTSLKISGTPADLVASIPRIGMLPRLCVLEVEALSNNDFSPESAEFINFKRSQFAKWLRDDLPSITELKIRSDIVDDLVTDILSRSSEVGSLQKLHLISTSSLPPSREAREAFCAALSKCQWLVQFIFEEPGTGKRWHKATLDEFINAIAKMRQLHDLTLEMPRLRPRHFTQLMSSLWCLQTVDMTCGLTDECLEQIAKRINLQSVRSRRQRSRVSTSALVALFKARDDPDSVPVSISLEGGKNNIKWFSPLKLHFLWFVCEYWGGVFQYTDCSASTRARSTSPVNPRPSKMAAESSMTPEPALTETMEATSCTDEISSVLYPEYEEFYQTIWGKSNITAAEFSRKEMETSKQRDWELKAMGYYCPVPRSFFLFPENIFAHGGPVSNPPSIPLPEPPYMGAMGAPPSMSLPSIPSGVTIAI
ncbi:uncharacterized protein V1510DRAFT_238165 [Dipodascopsis tothii]|uniref:uncharacterized protein n=1 Tax=Dipodascopsis tothii TaxID=44089 RepID=UPI0034CEFBF1